MNINSKRVFSQAQQLYHIKPLRSVNSKLFETIEAAGKSYILYLQEKAPGKITDINNPAEFNEALFFNLGALMGSEKRFIEELATLPVEKDNYGIVHFDIHTDNFLVENGKITLIDFEACQFNWYAADIASTLFFMVQKGAGPLKNPGEKQRTEFAEAYLISYLKGYLQTNSISKYWINTIGLFMKCQMIDEYVATQIYWPDESGHLRQCYSDWYKERIVHNLSYVDIDYNKVIHSLPEIPLV